MLVAELVGTGVGVVSDKPARDAMKLGIEPRRLVVTSEAYVQFTSRGYAPVVDVIDRKTKREYVLYISAQSLTMPLEQLRKENGGCFTGIEFWARKESESRSSKYIVVE